jgi:hypothetical protein
VKLITLLYVLAVFETAPDGLILSAGHPPACLNMDLENLCRRADQGPDRTAAARRNY